MNARVVFLLAAWFGGCTLAVAQTGTYADYEYLSNAEISPEGHASTFDSGEALWEPIHTNDAFNISDLCCPMFMGLATCGADYVINLTENWYVNVFQGGLVLRSPGISLDFEDTLLEIRNAVQEPHHYTGFAIVDGDTQAVTTYLKFSHNEYAVAQYCAGLVQAELDSLDQPTGIYDTLYVTQAETDWLLRPLPDSEGEEVIVVEGVCRLEGFVEGRITVLASDSMFIMDDLVTSDVILSNCGDNSFGRVPEGSSNCIGLIGEKDIIVAATLPNGAFDGAYHGEHFCVSQMGPAWQGGPAMPANIDSCNNAHRDVVITASILALGCTFETEFWHTSATASPIPPSEGTGMGSTSLCNDGLNDSHVAYWDCGYSTTADRRGTLWFDGSLVQILRGYRLRNPVGPWGDATIGYSSFLRRYDRNLYHRAPPMWPPLENPMCFELLLPQGISATGGIKPWELQGLANNDSIGIRLPTVLENCYLPDFFKLSIDGVLLQGEFEIEAREILLTDSSAAVMLPFPAVPFIEDYLPGEEFFYQLGAGGWNHNGQKLRWTLEAGPVAADVETLGVAEGVQPVFSEFVQRWNSTTSSFRITERADVNLLVRLVDGSGNVLSESEFSNSSFDLPALDAELYSDTDAFDIHVEVYAPWSDQTWSSAGTTSWWYNPDTDVSPRELPQALSLCAFPNPFNPSTTVELALPRSGEVKLTLYDLQGRQLRVIREAAMAAGLYHIPVHAQRLASGLYLLRVEAPGATGQRQQQVHKLLLVR